MYPVFPDDEKHKLAAEDLSGLVDEIHDNEKQKMCSAPRVFEHLLIKDTTMKMLRKFSAPQSSKPP